MKYFKIAAAVILCGLVVSTDAYAGSINYLGFCNNGRQDFVSTEANPSEQPGVHSEEFGFGDEGRYTMVVHSDRKFKFDAFAYIRDDAQDDWIFHKQQKNTDVFSPQVKVGEWGKLLLIQIVKLGSNCPRCNAYMTLTSTGCKPEDNSTGTTPALQQNLPPQALCSVDSECASNACVFSFCM